jgi:hypothetical protein
MTTSLSKRKQNIWTEIKSFDLATDTYKILWQDTTFSDEKRISFEKQCQHTNWISDWWNTQPNGDIRPNPKTATQTKKPSRKKSMTPKAAAAVPDTAEIVTIAGTDALGTPTSGVKLDCRRLYATPFEIHFFFALLVIATHKRRKGA